MIFADTGAFVARFLGQDAHHQEVLKAWQRLERSGKQVFTSNFVIDEVLTLTGRRAGYQFAAERGRNLYLSQILTILRPEDDDEQAALSLFLKYADQRVSFTDCVSFALMKKNKIRCAFSFDRHFQMAGFKIW
ncbi:MAG: PIN domain-containing protein [Deltaproteobacteria bacterium]|nr:PIN domain-containing protein [Deltaproteobacteria bacterium]